MQEENKMLGHEKILKLLIKFAVPCIIALLISALYNIVDQIFIGHGTTEGLGAVGNAATSVVFPLTLVAVAFAGTFGDGTAAFLSICQGRKDTKESHRAVGNSVVLTFIVSLILVALGLTFSESILTAFGASGENLLYAKQYFLIILSFFPVYMLGYMLNSVIRADGAPTFAMIATVAGALTNIILDPIFIFALNWGIRGAAWATVIGQVITLLISIFYLTRTQTFKLKLVSLKLEKSLLGNVVKLGVSTFITQLSIVAISMACNRMLAIFGAKSVYGANDPLAIIGICMKVFTIVLSIAMGIIIGAQPILGFNIGAERHDRVRETFRKCTLATIVVGVIATIIFELCPQYIINIFGSNSENPELYMQFAVLTFRIFLMLITFTCLIKVISIFFQAVGEPLKAAAVSLLRDILIFIPLVIILPNAMRNIEGILWAAPIADIIGMAVSGTLALRYFKQLQKNEAEPKEEETMIASSKPGIIVTIAREHGTQGKQIGKQIAEALSVPFYDKEIVALAAEKSGLNAEYLNKVWDDTNELDSARAEANENQDAEGRLRHELYLTTSPAKYAVEAQEAAVKAVARAGSCVIVGRAADYVLRHRQDLLRIFIYGSQDLRVKNIMAMYGDTEVEAKKHLTQSDQNRAQYYNLISGQKWGDPHNYDLCLDVALGKEKIVQAVVKLVREEKIAK